MLPQTSNSLMYKKHSITTTLGVVVMLLLFFSCGGGKKEVGDAISERDSLPCMSTLGVITFISDSGITNYKMVAEEWLTYDKKNPPYQAFEKGAYLEKFDSLLNVEASIKADTVYNYDKKQLWELRGNVEIENVKGERFETELLYWDQNSGRVYSDKFIKIDQIERIIYCIGFESNQDMTDYVIRKPTGQLYFEESQPSDSTKTLPADSMQIQPVDSIQTQPVDSIN